tara:strand:+ start:19247 stop:19573 length:327 start_codon:yes stop_codon:yes gene_type:complete
MSIFKEDISNEILYDFLKIHCILENNYYVLDKLIYKKYEYNNQIDLLKDKLKEKYKDSKKFYLERKNNYNNLLTIIRHLCKKNNINYRSKIKYDKNKYYIIYYIENIE